MGTKGSLDWPYLDVVVSLRSPSVRSVVSHMACSLRARAMYKERGPDPGPGSRRIGTPMTGFIH